MNDNGLLVAAFVFLLAAVVAVPLFKRLGLGSVLGYLIAGLAIGPWGLALVRDVEDVLHFAELGVVLLLFLIGLELNPRRLWSLRRPIFGLGGAQVLLTACLLATAGLAIGIDWRAAVVAGMGLAMSSTAIALQLLNERNLLPTPAGNAGFSVLLFQDMAVIPMLAAVPLLAVNAAHAAPVDAWLGVLKGAAVIVTIVVAGRYALRPLFRLVAGSRVREIFTAFSLLLVLGTALLMQAAGMSMALGTFVAGVLLADSEYRHALESDIEPFKGLLLGLFFISVGMSVDVGLLLARPVALAGVVLGLLAVKAAVLWALARWYGLPRSQHLLLALLLSQGGEFAFVLFAVAEGASVLSGDAAGLLVGAVAVSMMTTPLLLALHRHFVEPRRAVSSERPADAIAEAANPVIIAGFGRFGQVVGRLLHANGIGTTILDHDPQHIEMVRRFHFKVFYGDAGRLDLLRAAGADHANVLVLAVDDRHEALRIVEIVRQHFPNLVLLSRAWDVVHFFELREKGVLDVERETFEGALKLGEEALRRLGFTNWQARQAASQFRVHDAKLLEEIYRHFREDLDVRASISASARERLREQMLGDEAFFGTHQDADWR
jgi:glutathione-regulated potassium-efflux system ancillary protein KefC